MERLNRELERSLRSVKRLQDVRLNRQQVLDACGWECVEELRKGGFVEYADGRECESMYGEFNRVQLTVKGRNYWSEVRRDWWRDSAKWLFSVVGVVTGSVLTFCVMRLIGAS